MSEKSVFDLIREWAKDRNLILGSHPDKQFQKLIEEVGELAQGLAKDRQDLIIDSIGDVVVVLTILSAQLGLSIESCINDAYIEIKDRKGRMVNGVFIKESDLGKAVGL